MAFAARTLKQPPTGDGALPKRTQEIGLWLLRGIFGAITLAALVSAVAGIAPRFHVLATLARQGQRALGHISPEAAHSPLGAALSPAVFPYYVLSVEACVVAAFLFAALLLIWRKADEPRVLFFGMVFVTTGVYFTRFLDALQASAPGWRPLVHGLQAIGLVGSVLFFLLFPDGRFMPRWTVVLGVLWAAINGIWFINPAVPFNFANPYTLNAPWFWLFAGFWLAGVAAQIYRYARQRDATLRRQTRWIVLSTISGALCYGVYVAPLILFPTLKHAGDANALYNTISVPVYFTLFLSIPLCILIAILYLRLWDVEIVINRALVYGALTGCIVAVYVACLVTLQIVLNGLAGRSQLALAGSTLAVALVFQPLRQRIRRSVERRFYQRRYANSQLITAFVRSLEHDTDLQRIQRDLLAVVAKTTQPRALGLWLRDQDAPPEPS